MVSIILACSEEVKLEAIARGFREQTVLVRQESGLSTPKEQARIEVEVGNLRPFQYLVSDYWGMGPD